MKKIGAIVEEIKFKDRPKNISQEFQQYGVYLAESLDDTKHYSLYIKLAKITPRALLDEALTFTKGYLAAKSKPKVFMWRLKQLKTETKQSF